MGSVCGTCSPSQIKVEGERQLQRACTPCVAYAYKTPLLKERMIRLSDGFRILVPEVTTEPDVVQDLEGALVQCERTLPLIEQDREQHVELKAQHEDLIARFESG